MKTHAALLLLPVLLLLKSTAAEPTPTPTAWDTPPPWTPTPTGYSPTPTPTGWDTWTPTPTGYYPPYPAPAPTPTPTGMTGSPTYYYSGSTSIPKMDFGGSDGSAMESSSGSWSPTPRTSGSFAGNFDWSWPKGSASSSSPSSSGSSENGYPDYEDDAGVEVSFPGIDGSVESSRRQWIFLNRTGGFSTTTTDATTGIVAGNCPYAFCVHFVFESDYGAMTPFDAFVLDRYETSTGPLDFYTDAWHEHGPLPLVLGRLSDETRQRIQGNWTNDVFNWNETRRTTWTLGPASKNNHWPPQKEIDVTLSLKQLYTLLPGYENSFNMSDGPFYSDDVTDQLIIRVNGHVPSAFSGASAMLPIVVNHTGSQLIDINLTSTLLYEGAGVNGGNELQLTFKLSRRKYGGMTPWFPAKPARECDGCSMYRPIPELFQECVDDRVSRQHMVFEDLLSFRNNRTAFDLEPYAEACFAAILSGEWTNGTNTTAPMRYWNGTDWAEESQATPHDVDKRWEILRQIDNGLRCWTETQCPVGGGTVKSDAEVVVLRHEPARTVIQFNRPSYSFYLQMALEGAAGQQGTITTPVFASSTPPEEIVGAISRSFVDANQLRLDIEVRKHNNSNWIQWIRMQNQWAMDEYERALAWSGTSNSQGSEIGDGDAGWADDSNGPNGWEYNPSGSDRSSDRGSDGGSTGDADAGDSSSGDGGSWGPTPTPTSYSSTSRPRPAKPTLIPVPPEMFTIEIISRNITTVPYVVAVFSDDGNVSYSTTDNSLQFEIAPLDVSKFEYVPPPPYVDLSWETEPEWMADVRRHLPTFAPNDTCGSCVQAYEACLFDFDCAFGVNDYLSNALRRSNLWYLIMLDTPSGAPPLYKVNVTDTLKNARRFFPARGYDKFQNLLACWQNSQCNFDYDRQIRGDSAPPTVLRTMGTRVEVVASMGEFITFMNDGVNYTWALMSNDSYILKNFLTNVVFANAVEAARDVAVEFDTMMSGTFRLQWDSYTPYGFEIRTQYATSSVSFLPAETSIAAERRKVVDESDGSIALQWPRLEHWLDLFRFVRASSYPGWNGGNNGTNWTGNSNWTSGSNWTSDSNWSTPSPAPPTLVPSSVCWSCAGLLQSCASDIKCSRVVSNWLPTVLPESFAAYRDWDDVYRSYWNTELLNNDTTTDPNFNQYRDQVLALVSCVAKNGCPIGAGNITTANSWEMIPTTMRFQSTRRMHLARGSTFSLFYKDLYVFQADEHGSDLQGYMDLIEYQYGEKIVFTLTTTNDMVEFEFSGSYHGIGGLVFAGYGTPSYTSAITHRAWLESHAPALPNWNFLATWYGAPNSMTSCPECIPKLQACHADSVCWKGVRELIVPILKQQTAQLPWTSWFESSISKVVYDVDLGAVLRATVLDVPPVPETYYFTMGTSWKLFTDILACFATNVCDVETMNSAMEAPATTHIPSFFKTQNASATLFLYLDSQLRVEFKGQVFDYTETATGTSDPLSMFLENALAGMATPYWVELTGRDDSVQAYKYKITFDAAYLGRLPSLSILTRGAAADNDEPFATMEPWKILIHSTSQIPQWDLLTMLLSSPPPPTSEQLEVFQCPEAVAARSSCYSSYDCSLLLTRALPVLQSHLETGQPVSNTWWFELDLTWLLISQVFPGTAQSTIDTFLDVLWESASCSARLTSSGSAMPMFLATKIEFDEPANSSITLQFRGEMFELPADPTDYDRIQTMEAFMFNHTSERNVSPRHSYRDDVMFHMFVYERIYVLPPPHLSAVDPSTGAPVESTDHPWRLSFRSPSFALNDAFVPWLSWLATSLP